MVNLMWDWSKYRYAS